MTIASERATQVRHLIGGEWVDSSSGETFQSVDPHDLSVLADVARGTPEDAERAITSARKAFEQGPWPRMAPIERARILYDLAALVDEHADELALLESRDGGKPIREASHADIPRVAHNLRFFADYVKLTGNESYPNGPFLSYTLYPAAGVVIAISPWNAPLMLATWKVAPALAFGNTVVLKPAEQTPLSAARFGELALEAGLPEGVLNIVQGFGDAGAALTNDPRISRITFTGSSEVGRLVMEAGARNLVPVSLELGGKSANVVFADANMDDAVAGSIRGIFSNNGQVCLSGSRLLVERRVLDEFLERFTAAARELRMGDPKDPQTHVGPLIEREHREKVHSYVELARDEGGRVVLGGEPVVEGDLAQGCYYPPTVLADMTNEMRTAREEIFGPVESVIAFDTEEEAVRIANDSPYGLVGTLWTQNLDRAHRMAANWQAGTVWINCFFERDLRLPFGGEGLSGVGREGGAYSREFFTEPRAITLKLRTEPGSVRPA